MKLLVVNLQNPKETQYRSPKDIGTWMWGRRLSNYPMFVLLDNGSLVQIEFSSSEVGDIQAAIDGVFST